MQPASASVGVLPAWDWLETYLVAKFPSDSLTLRSYLHQWRVWQRFLIANDIATPARLTRDHIFKFVKWREDNGTARITACHNTVVMAVWLKEALTRGLVEKNVASCLQLRVGKFEEKPEITPELEAEIRQAIDTERKHKDFLRISFEIGIRQGCRIAGTRLHVQKQVNFDAGTIDLWVKGGKWLHTALHPATAAILRPIKGWSYDEPLDPMLRSRTWLDFFERHGFKQRPGMEKLCYHSCRVTTVTRLARAGITESKCMAFVGHSSIEVHRIYQRLRAPDLADCLAAL